MKFDRIGWSLVTHRLFFHRANRCPMVVEPYYDCTEHWHSFLRSWQKCVLHQMMRVRPHSHGTLIRQQWPNFTRGLFDTRRCSAKRSFVHLSASLGFAQLWNWLFLLDTIWSISWSVNAVLKKSTFSLKRSFKLVTRSNARQTNSSKHKEWPNCRKLYASTARRTACIYNECIFKFSFVCLFSFSKCLLKIPRHW